MHQFDGFPDLRLNSRAKTTETTLWPSFTDIMTDILMVFMLTMVVVIVKNAHLVERVRLSQRLQEQADSRMNSYRTRAQNLQFLNTDLEDRVRSKEMEIILLHDEAQLLEEGLSAKLLIIDRLTEENRELLENIRIIRARVRDQEDAVEAMELQLATAAEDTRIRTEELSNHIAELLSLLQENETVMIELSSEKSDLELALARQRQDYSSLEDQYLRLIRPARSSLGKLVATVQYSRNGDTPRIMFRDIDGQQLEEITSAEMHQRLAALKAQHGADLYVKIVIPDDSGLSYNEAWDFTKEVLSQYDYYYIDGWPGESK